MPWTILSGSVSRNAVNTCSAFGSDDALISSRTLASFPSPTAVTCKSRERTERERAVDTMKETQPQHQDSRLGNNIGNDIGNNIGNEIGKNIGNDIGNNIGNEIGKDIGNSTTTSEQRARLIQSWGHDKGNADDKIRTADWGKTGAGTA